MNNPIEEARKREVVQLIQSRCVHRRRGIIKTANLFYQKKIVYCQDCEKILYDLEER
jgi:hypothetical protein